jgi:hypothetical protein
MDVDKKQAEGGEVVTIGNKEYSEILITDENDGLIASITDENIVEEKGYKVTCVPLVEE